MQQRRYCPARDAESLLSTFVRRLRAHLTLVAAGAAASITSSCAKPPSDLLTEAHGAAQGLFHDAEAAKFDDSVTQVFPEQGLVCGSKVNVGAGPDTGYQRYYFSRSRGAVVEGGSSSWIPLANSCFAAIVHRAAIISRSLEAENREPSSESE